MSELDRARAGQYVAARRGRLGLSQDDLAARAGIDPKTLRDLETGKRWPRAKTRTAIEDALDIETGDLLRLAEGGMPAPDRRDLLLNLIYERAAELRRDPTGILREVGLINAGGKVVLREALDTVQATTLDRLLRWQTGSAQAALAERRPPIPLPARPSVDIASWSVAQSMEMRRLPKEADEAGEAQSTSELLERAWQLVQQLEQRVDAQSDRPERAVRAVKQLGLAMEALEEELGDAG